MMSDIPRTRIKPVDEERGRQILAARRAASEKRRQDAAARLGEGLQALRRLVEIAKADTGQARRVADFLLSWWNAESCGRFDLTDLWMVDGEITDDMTAVFRLVADHHVYPTHYGLEDDFARILAQWRPEFVKKAPMEGETC